MPLGPPVLEHQHVSLHSRTAELDRASSIIALYRKLLGVFPRTYPARLFIFLVSIAGGGLGRRKNLSRLGGRKCPTKGCFWCLKKKKAPPPMHRTRDIPIGNE